MVKYIALNVVAVLIAVVTYLTNAHAFPQYDIWVGLAAVVLNTVFGILDGKTVMRLRARLVRANLSPD